MADEDRLAQRAILQRMFEASVDGVSVMDLAAQRYIMVNPAKLAIMGYSMEEYLGLNPLDTIMDKQPGGRTKYELAQEHFAILAAQGHHSGDILLKRKDGSALLCSVSSQQIDHLGQSMLVTFIRPIADKVLIETRMREAQLLKDALLGNSFDGLLLYDIPLGKWVVTNQTMSLLTGYDQDVLLQIPMDKLFGEESQLADHTGMLLHDSIAALRPGERAQFIQRVRCIDGDTFMAEVNTMRLEEPEEHLAVVAIKDISKSLELSRQLEETRKKFQGLFEHSVLGLITLNQQGIIQMVNTTLCHMLQLQKEEFLGLSFGVFLYGKDSNRDKAGQINDLIVQRSGFALERRHTLPSGRNIWLRFRSRPLYEAAVGEFTVLTAVEDITERKLITDKLILSESKLKEAATMAKLAHWNLDYKLKIFEPSFEFFDLLELTPDVELSFEAWMGHVAPEDRERVMLNWEEALAFHRPLSIEYDLITNRGKRKHVLGMYKVVLDTVGEVDQVFGIVQDITDKRLAIEALAQSETRFRRLAENSPNVMFKLRVHPDLAMEYASPAVERMFGYSVQELLSPHRFQEFRIIDKKLAAVIGRYLLDGEWTKSLICQMPRADASLIWVEVKCSPIINDGGDIEAFEGVIVDIDALKRKEAQLMEQKADLIAKNNELEQFTYIASHDLRSPVVNINTLLGMLEIDKMEPENKEVFKRLQMASHKLYETLHDLIDVISMDKRTTSPFEKLNISELINDIRLQLTELIDQSNAEIQEELDVKEMRFVRVHLKSILLNLITNAIKYRSPNRYPRIGIHAFHTGDHVAIKVSDNGLGMNLDRMGNRLFGMFQVFHEGKGGKGLGLYLTKRQIEQFGGQIFVESTPGQGTTFTVYLKEQ